MTIHSSHLKLSFLTLLITFNHYIQAQTSKCDSTKTCYENGICCDSDITPAGVMISHVHSKNEWMASYRLMNMAMNGVMKGTKEINNSELLNNYLATPQNMQMNMHMLMLMYGISDRLTLMSMFHYNINWMKMSMKMGNSMHSHTMKTSGVGDVKISALYALIKKYNSQLILGLGGNLPTGSIELKGKPKSMMYPNERYPYNMQLGSGTFDILPTISFLSRINKFYYSAQLNAIVRLNKNSIGYTHGNEYNILAWAAYRFHSALSSSIRFEGIYSESLKGIDPTLDSNLEIAADNFNYGGTRINTNLGLVFQPLFGWLSTSKFCLEFGTPIYQNFQGYQMKTTHQLLFTYNLSF